MNQALMEIGLTTGSPGLARVAFQLAASLLEGKSLADAMNETAMFGQVDIRLVHAGEISGGLDEMIRRLEEDHRRAHDVRADIRQFLVMPIVVLIGLAAATTVYRFFLIPMYRELMESLGTPFPESVRWFQRIYDLSPIGISLVVVGVFLARRFGGLGPLDRYRESIERMILRLPLLGRCLLDLDLVRVYGIYLQALQAGLNPCETFRLMADVCRLKLLRRPLRELVESIEQPSSSLFGRSPGTILYESEVWPRRDAHLVRVGLQTGALERVIAKLYRSRHADFKRSVNEMVKVVEPALVVLMGLVVLATALVFYGPFYQVISQVQ